MPYTIYLISSPNTDKVYIGSTTQKLSHRFNNHSHVSNNTKSKIIIDYGNATITAIDSVEDDDLEELKIKELEYITFYKDICVNLKGTKDCYSKNYKSPSNLDPNYKRPSQLDPNYKSPYRLDGRRKVWENTKNDCCICGGSYINVNKTRHLKTKKHLACM